MKSRSINLIQCVIAIVKEKTGYCNPIEGIYVGSAIWSDLCSEFIYVDDEIPMDGFCLKRCSGYGPYCFLPIFSHEVMSMRGVFSITDMYKIVNKYERKIENKLEAISNKGSRSKQMKFDFMGVCSG